MKTGIAGEKHEAVLKHREDVGHPEYPTKNTVKVNVTTSDDMRFNFSKKLNLHDGDVVTFIVKNKGNVSHEFSIGNESDQKAHQKMMRQMPNMVHNDANTITLRPGETKTITWKFKGPSEVVFACNIPGHFEAGMYKKEKIKLLR